MAYDKPRFMTEIGSALKSVKQLDSTFAGNAPNVYWEWYSMARGQKEIILGRGQDIRSLVKEYGYAQAGGSILLGAQTWDILVNDCWILGGVHSHAVFYLKTVLSQDTVYSAADKGRTDPTRILYVTTREIAGLNLFGYSMTDSKDARGQKLECTQPALADRATFGEYHAHVQAIARAAR
jgi:hypothetical protein